MRIAPASLAAAALLLSTAACSTHYVPQARGRLAVVMDPSMGLYKDGKTYRPGLFGGDIDEAVAGNPRAEDEATAYQNDQTVGTACTFIGLASVVAGVTVLGADFPTSNQTNGLPPSLGLMLGGLALDLIGLGFSLAAQGHLWDAVNIYNDGVSDGPRPPAPHPAP